MGRTSLTSRIAALYELQARCLEPKLKSLGIGWGTFQLLATVHGSGGQASQAEVARRLGVAPATLCESVQTHVRKGMLRQMGSGLDKRVKYLSLTEKGERMVADAMAELDVVERAMVGGLSLSDRQSTASILDICLENLEQSFKKH